MYIMSDIYRNLSNQFPDSTKLTGTSDLSTSIGSLNTNLDSIQNKSNTLLSQQNEIKNIVDRETDRLELKKNSVENAYTSQNRAVYINDNISKRNNAYLQILFAIVIALVIVFILSIMGSYFPVIPSIVLNIIYVCIFSVIIIYSISIYSEIQTHDRIDYDKLKLKKATVAGNSDISGNYDASANATTTFGSCKTVDNKGVCTELSAFTCMGAGLQTVDSYEFKNYSRY